MNQHIIQLLRQLYGYQDLGCPYTPPNPEVYVPVDGPFCGAAQTLEDCGLVRMFFNGAKKAYRVSLTAPLQTA
jgi:hypothetical protein